MTQKTNIDQLINSGAKVIKTLNTYENVSEIQCHYLCRAVALFIHKLIKNRPPKLTSDLFIDYMYYVYLFLEHENSDFDLDIYFRFCAYWRYVLFEIGLNEI